MNAPDDNAVRSRTITWEDPLIGASLATTMAGIDYLAALLDGSIPPPPIVTLMNMQLLSIEPGVVAFSCLPGASSSPAHAWRSPRPN
jgi:hypothetical protein